MSTHSDHPLETFYYLNNFQMVLDWLAQRYPDLLDPGETRFIENFTRLPKLSRALLVRMVMRKGELFRASKLQYPEIGATPDAAAPLITLNWLEPQPTLTIEQLFALFTKPELAALLALPPQLAKAKKSGQLAALQASGSMQEGSLPAWFGTDYAQTEPLYQLRIMPLCERFRLMFFGNLHQDWSEFILSDLGIYQWEKVEIAPTARGFQSREDIDHYLSLFQCREQWQQGVSMDQTLATLAKIPISRQSWLERRRERLLFSLGQAHEREQNFSAAHDLYQGNSSPEARIRQLRVLIRNEQYPAAHALAQQMLDPANTPTASEVELQHLQRILPRLHKKLPANFARLALASSPLHQVPELCFTLAASAQYSVEQLAAQHLAHAHANAPAPVFYVENTLINSLFGLLCWDAIFYPLAGAFFNPYQRGPVDLLSPDFYPRRRAQFGRCLALLDSDAWQTAIWQTWHAKQGLQSNFVAWQILSQELLELALLCIPAAHLRLCFERLLQDIAGNRSGWPDLIQFWPASRSYWMIEVKGPGDRLQDNQIRCLQYCASHQIPVSVCHVDYAADDESDAAPPDCAP